MTHGLPPLAEARWPDVDRADRRVLLWPIGSTEQHGPHLPLNTDSVIATALASQAHRVHPTVGLAPCLTLGASGEHAGFPGTLSIGTDALRSVIVEFVRHASVFWRHVVVVNGHGGNASALADAAALMTFEGRSLVVHHASSAESAADAHAGFRETSLMLHLDSASVAMDLAEPGSVEPLADILPALRAGGVRTVSVNGVLGDPRGATAAHGAAVFSGMCDALSARVAALLVS